MSPNRDNQQPDAWIQLFLMPTQPFSPIPTEIQISRVSFLTFQTLPLLCPQINNAEHKNIVELCQIPGLRARENVWSQGRSWTQKQTNRGERLWEP